MKHILIVDDLATITVDQETEYGAVTYARTSEAALTMLQDSFSHDNDSYGWLSIDEIWLDHDLGGDDTIRPVVQWMEEYAHWNPCADMRPSIRIISHNPVGRAYIRAALEKYYTIEEDNPPINKRAPLSKEGSEEVLQKLDSCNELGEDISEEARQLRDHMDVMGQL